MNSKRGREHTTLTETAALVTKELSKLPHIKMIAPGEIRTTNKRTAGTRYVTAITTTAGLELLISGQSVQKLAIHTDRPRYIVNQLKNTKSLRDFVFNERERKPGV